MVGGVVEQVGVPGVLVVVGGGGVREVAAIHAAAGVVEAAAVQAGGDGLQGVHQAAQVRHGEK